jgi:transcriptional regulator with XRE-family HTH domain
VAKKVPDPAANARAAALMAEANAFVTRTRAALRSARKQHYLKSSLAAKAIGMGASTVARVENLRGDAKYDPSLGTVVRLARAFDLDLAGLFADISAGIRKSEKVDTETDHQILTSTEGSAQNAPLAHPREAPDVGGQVSLGATVQLALAQALISAGTNLAGAVGGAAPPGPSPEVQKSRSKKPGGRKGGHADR